MRFETVFLYLYDVGRSVDLGALGRSLPQGVASPLVGRRLDTPASLQLPTPLWMDLGASDFGGPCFLESLRFRAKVYEEGVVTIECRAEADLSLDELHTFRFREVPDTEGAATLDVLADRHFQRLLGRIQGFVNQDQYRFDPTVREDYHVYCLLEDVGDPQGFLRDHQDYLAPFLLGENPGVSLHASQIATTMANPFSFTARDAAVFDMDRAFLVAPDRDYEDLVLILEHANYQLLELRALDRLLDRLLDDAEDDLRGARTKGPKIPSLTQKLGYLQPLRLDALFILENLENSSRIIGDYYLEQVYDHLCGMFNTGGWRQNVEKRLELLQSLYTMTKADKTDATMVLLEAAVVVMIGLELVALFFPLFH